MTDERLAATTFRRPVTARDGRPRRSAARAIGCAVLALGAVVLAARAPEPAVAAAAPSAPAPAPVRLADRYGAGSAGLLRQHVVVGGLGSSVGAGATLLRGDLDAPVAWFGTTMAAHVEDRADVTVVNGSVSGSTIHDGLARDWAVLERSHPDVVVLAYGMNDGAPAQFEAGETFAGSMQDLASLIGEIRASGAIPVLLTSPSAHTTRTSWDTGWLGPTTPQQSPVDTSVPVRQVEVPGVGTAPESTRHAAVDEGMRRVASALDVDVVDVERFWLRAVASRGEDALFRDGEFVHPNLLGHRLSYHAAIDDWFDTVALQPFGLRPSL